MWEDDKGDKRRTTEVVIENQYFAESKNKGNSEDKPEDKFYPIDDNVEDEDLPF